MTTSKKKINSDRIVAFTAILISSCALIVSFLEVRIMRSQQTASVWPYVQLSQHYDSEGFSLDADNKGIGPAKILSLQVTLDDLPIEDLDELFTKTIGEGHGLDYEDYLVGDINKSVIEPGYEKYLIRLVWNEKTRMFQKQLGRVEMEVIYASIFGDCWKTSTNYDSTPCDCPQTDELGIQFNF